MIKYILVSRVKYFADLGTEKVLQNDFITFGWTVIHLIFIGRKRKTGQELLGDNAVMGFLSSQGVCIMNHLGLKL